MRPWVVSIFAVLILNFFLLTPCQAILNRDIRYVHGIVVKIDEAKKELTIKDSESGKAITFDVRSARYSDIKKGQKVFVVVPINSNAAKLVKVVVN